MSQVVCLDNSRDLDRLEQPPELDQMDIQLLPGFHYLCCLEYSLEKWRATLEKSALITLSVMGVFC